MSEPREYTEEEARTMLLEYLIGVTNYWVKEGKTKEDVAHGVLFTVLSTLDGCSIEIPCCSPTTSPHPDDKEYHKSNGNNWWPERMQLGSLHELLGSVEVQLSKESRDKNRMQ